MRYRLIPLAFDPEKPELMPPTGAHQPLLWSLARQVFADHDVPDDDGRPELPRCARCAEVWPCEARVLAENGLVVACAPPGRWSDVPDRPRPRPIVVAPPADRRAR